MVRQSKKLLRNKSVKRSKLNSKRLGRKKTKQRKPWKKRRMKGGMEEAEAEAERAAAREALGNLYTNLKGDNKELVGGLSNLMKPMLKKNGEPKYPLFYYNTTKEDIKNKLSEILHDVRPATSNEEESENLRLFWTDSTTDLHVSQKLGSEYYHAKVTYNPAQEAGQTGHYILNFEGNSTRKLDSPNPLPNLQADIFDQSYDKPITELGINYN